MIDFMVSSQVKIYEGGRNHEKTTTFELYHGNTRKIKSNKPEPNRTGRQSESRYSASHV